MSHFFKANMLNMAAGDLDMHPSTVEHSNDKGWLGYRPEFDTNL